MALMLVGVSETIVQSEPILPSRLGRIATRGIAGSGSIAMIAGTVVQGTTPKQMSAFGVSGTLADPILKVVDCTGTVLATNDNWTESTTTSGRVTTGNDAIAAGAASGAFALAANSKDAATTITLVPGYYTIRVSGASNGTGLALVEVYDIPTG